jgi:hypothetical protein
MGRVFMTVNKRIKRQARQTVFMYLLTVSSLFAASTELPEFTTEGLQHLGDTQFAVVYAKPGVAMGQYKRLYLDDTNVAFKKNWQRDRNRLSSGRISNSDMTRIKSDLAVLFRDVFTRTLEDGGYALASEYDNDVLLIKPGIINLDIVAPESNTAGRSQTFAESAGEMTLYLELYDSVSGELLAKALDRQQDRQTGYMRWQNRITNRAAANRILQLWADVLKQGLDEARGNPQSGQPISQSP